MKKNHKNSYTHRDINNIKASNQPFNIRVKFLHVNLKKFYNRARRVRTKRNQYESIIFQIIISLPFTIFSYMVTANDLTCRIIKLIKRNHQNFCIPIYLHILTAKIKNNNKELRKFPYTLKMWRTASTAIYGRILLLVCQTKKKKKNKRRASELLWETKIHMLQQREYDLSSISSYHIHIHI